MHFTVGEFRRVRVVLVYEVVNKKKAKSQIDVENQSSHQIIKPFDKRRLRGGYTHSLDGSALFEGCTTTADQELYN